MPLIRIVGPTATGKSNRALSLAKVFVEQADGNRAIIISADSRQVYHGLEVLTGVDLPDDFAMVSQSPLPFFNHATLQISLHGLSCVNPDQEWSVAHFQHLALPLIEHALINDQLAVLVGGTLLYHQQLFNHRIASEPAPDQSHRNYLQQLSVVQLQTELDNIDPERFAQLNDSDRLNPRRLIRWIEKAGSTHKSIPTNDSVSVAPNITTEWLDAPDQELELRITQRVVDRWQQGALDEVKWLSKHYPDRTLRAWSSLGIPSIEAFFQGDVSVEQAQQDWVRSELKYAKKQRLWKSKLTQVH